MRNFKILVIQHCLKNNQIAQFGDVVLENQLTSNADELIEAGFIEKVEEALKAEEAPKAKGKK